MNRAASWFKTVTIGHRARLTDDQLAGQACALCGQRIFSIEDRAGLRPIGLPFCRRVFACKDACTIETTEDTQALFRSAIPARQTVWFWHLGVDDVPLANDYNGFDVIDKAYVAEIAAQPKIQVRIAHPGGVLTTRPLPQEYADHIVVQAGRLGFTATIHEGSAAR